nr:PEGA domain-containing protein [Actinomycetota bacterium]
MEPVGSRVRVEANTDEAQFVVDGEVMGRVPWEGTIPVGFHDIEIRAEGYRTYHARLEFTEEPRLINEGLIPEGQMTAEERAEQAADMRRRHRQSVARSGAPLDSDVAVLDFSIGWPYIFELRMGIGILDWLDAGIGIRTFFRLTEFEGRVKAGIRPVKQVSLGVMARIGGGIGVASDDPLTVDESGDALAPADRIEGAPEGMGIVQQSTNSFFFSLEALFTLHFLRAGNFTLWGALDYHSDSYS